MSSWAVLSALKAPSRAVLSALRSARTEDGASSLSTRGVDGGCCGGGCGCCCRFCLRVRGLSPYSGTDRRGVVHRGGGWRVIVAISLPIFVPPGGGDTSNGSSLCRALSGLCVYGSMSRNKWWPCRKSSKRSCFVSVALRGGDRRMPPKECMGALPREVALAASGQRGWNSLGLGGSFGGGLRCEGARGEE